MAGTLRFQRICWPTHLVADDKRLAVSGCVLMQIAHKAQHRLTKDQTAQRPVKCRGAPA